MAPPAGKHELQLALRTCRTGLLGTLGFSFFVNLLVFVAPMYMLQVYDRVLTSRSETTLVLLAALAVALLLLMGFLDTMRSRLMLRTGARLDSQLSVPVFQALLTRSLRTNSLAQTQSLRDLVMLRDFFAGQGFLAFCDAPWVPVFIFVGFLFHTWIGISFVVGALTLFVLAMINEFATRKLLSEAGRTTIAADGLAEASMRNAEVITAMGMLPGMVARWGKRRDDALAQQIEAGERTGTVLASSKTARLLVQVGVLTVGAYLVIQQELTPGAMVAASIIMARALAPVEQAVGYWKVLIAAQAAYRRLAELLRRFPQEKSKLSHPPPKGHLTVGNLVMVPPGRQTPTLSGVDFKLAPGDVLGIIGPSAAGKSTLVRALVNVWPPAKGAVRLDNIELAHWNGSELGQHIGYLPQDVELFDGTVVENIARFSEPDDQRVLKAARKAGVHELILGLPDGYETQIGDGGKSLSSGQRQRIALARALYGDPPLVVLDEPNSNLDSQGEQVLARVIKALQAVGHTVVVVTHRPALLACVSKVLLLVNGRAEAFGARDAVLQQLAQSKGRARDGLLSDAPASKGASDRPQRIEAGF